MYDMYTICRERICVFSEYTFEEKTLFCRKDVIRDIKYYM